jgi:hypothetical protein
MVQYLSGGTVRTSWGLTLRYNKRFQVKVGNQTVYNGDNYGQARGVFRREKDRAIDSGEIVLLINSGEVTEEYYNTVPDYVPNPRW